MVYTSTFVLKRNLDKATARRFWKTSRGCFSWRRIKAHARGGSCVNGDCPGRELLCGEAASRGCCGLGMLFEGAAPELRNMPNLPLA